MSGRQLPFGQRITGVWDGRERDGLPGVAGVEGVLAEGGGVTEYQVVRNW